MKTWSTQRREIMTRIGGLYLRQTGFTILELITVILIILVIGAASLMVYSRATRKGMETRARKEIEHLDAALRMYAEDTGYFPVDVGTFDGAASAIKAIEQDASAGYGDKPYATWPNEAKDSAGDLIDPWGQKYQYFSNTADSWFEGEERGLAYNIYSFGPKGSDPNLTKDDYIKNW